MYPYYGPTTVHSLTKPGTLPKFDNIQACEFMNLCMEGDRPYLPFIVTIISTLLEFVMFSTVVWFLTQKAANKNSPITSIRLLVIFGF